MKKYLIIGSGFAGSVIAEQLSKDSLIEMWEERNHIGGNCYTERDEDTGINIHKYGPHIFNTDNVNVWNYIQQFCQMMSYVNRVKSIYRGQVYSLPINLHTINQFFNKTFSPTQAKEFIQSLSDATIDSPKNFEEQALKFIGKDLYQAFFYGYTKKQWGCEPTELPASILKRLPVRFNYNDNYYTMPLQGIPKNGYTEIFEKMLSHPNITIHLNKRFTTNDADFSTYDQVFYTGPVDAFFEYKFGRLGYRTVFFEKHTSEGDFQGNAVINYADEETPFTRIHEHKHFTPWEEHEKTVYFKEFSKETEVEDIPYYPKRLTNDIEILEKYQEEINKLPKITFLGRLATYRYMDMHHVIANALEIAQKFK
ncbi:UDP-galactopyranose mutase [Pedobacter changchengzhani]|uniref:UDP-galactopyranose mutase n=1 Tax=Pedobacter changchengzhani TaxID=2529274 RepID=A0A4R5MNC8_9SPHI|nr:UDP-galactopyranose mutase [Pedobacter changchengzhani]TDG37148.1 UDP-galactopyranose mutase [Pedobacter changchengzhani]